MKTEAQIRIKGMTALIDALGLVEAEQFIAAVSKDKLDYTQSAVATPRFARTEYR